MGLDNIKFSVSVLLICVNIDMVMVFNGVVYKVMVISIVLMVYFMMD